MELGSILGPKRATFAVKQRRPVINNLIKNIDKKDIKNHLAVVEYVDELHNNYKLLEDRNCDYNMDLQKEIDENMRMSLVQLLFQIHLKLKLTPDIFFLAINTLDRYLSVNFVARKEFQLVGLTCLLMAGKYEEGSAAKVEKYLNAANGVYCKKEIRDMEKLILKKLGWNLSLPTIYHFIVRYVKAAEADTEMEKTMFWLAVSSLMKYPVVKSYSPSMIAASSFYAANCILEKNTPWNATLEHYTGLCEAQVMECSEHIW